MKRPERAVAWLKLPMRATDLPVVMTGLEDTYGDGLRLIGDGGEGIWVVLPERPKRSGGDQVAMAV